MRVRRLQRQDEEGQWYDDAYALEDSQGQVTFCYNLTWDRVGSAYNDKLQETGVALDVLETVLQPGEKFQWLPVEPIPVGEAAAFLDALDEQCAIPKPQRMMNASPIAVS